jgi:hypothetical protein
MRPRLCALQTSAEYSCFFGWGFTLGSNHYAAFSRKPATTMIAGTMFFLSDNAILKYMTHLTGLFFAAILAP